MDSSNKTSNPVLEKSYKFALRIVKLHAHVSKDLKQFEIYWLSLFKDSEIIESSLAESLLNDCEELLKLPYSIIISARKNPIVN
jgi:hypothetical protein